MCRHVAPTGESYFVQPTCTFAHLTRSHMAFERHGPLVPTGFTTICLPLDVHEALRDRKVHPRQPFHEVIAVLLNEGRRS